MGTLEICGPTSAKQAGLMEKNQSSGFVVLIRVREKSRSAVQSCDTPDSREILATRASWIIGPDIFPSIKLDFRNDQ